MQPAISAGKYVGPHKVWIRTIKNDMEVLEVAEQAIHELNANGAEWRSTLFAFYATRRSRKC